jgi:hypothetical protein
MFFEKTLSTKKLALTSLTSGGRSVGIVRLRTETTEFFFIPQRIFCQEFGSTHDVTSEHVLSPRNICH